MKRSISLLLLLALANVACEETSPPNPSRLSLERPDSLPPACVGEDYLLLLQVRGERGRTPSWGVRGLPPGISFTPEGARARISGAPTEAGRFSVSLEVRAGEERVAASFLIEVAEPLRITTSTLAPAVVGAPYEAVLEASREASEWSAAELPPGFSLASDGTLSGVPEAAGSHELEVEATHPPTQKTAVRTLRLEVLEDMPLAIAPGAVDPATGVLDLGFGVLGRTLSRSVAVSGGAPPLQWEVAGLPPGLALSPSDGGGEIAGIPTQIGMYAGTLRVRDERGERAEVVFRLRVVEPLEIATEPLETVPRCWRVEHPLRARGGSGEGYMWSILSGALPSGLSLAPDGAEATIEGSTAPSPEQASFVVELRDDLGLSARASFEVIVSSAGPPGERFLAFTGRLEREETGLFFLARCGTGAGVPVRVNPSDASFFNGTPSVSGRPEGMEIDREGERAVFVGADPMRPRGRVVYLADLRGGATAMSVVATSTHGAARVQPQFSPDGTWLAIIEEDAVAQTGTLWLVDVSDPAQPGAPRLVTRQLAGDFLTRHRLRFSPDGSRVAYRSYVGRDANLFVRDLTRPDIGPEVAAHGTLGRGDGVDDFFWTADSRGLVFLARLEDLNGAEPFFTDLQAPRPFMQQRILEPLPDRAVGFQAGSIRMRRFGASPSGDRLHLVGARSPGAVQEVLVVPYASGRFGAPAVVARLPDQPNLVIEMSWSPRGDRLAYAQSEGSELALHAVGVGGASPSAPVRLSDTLQGASVFSGVGGDHGWMCGGDVLVFLSDQAAEGLVQLYAADFRGPTVDVRTLGTGPLVRPGVESFRIAPNGAHVAFTQNTADGQAQGFVVTSLCSAAPGLARLHAPFTEAGLFAWAPEGLGGGPTAFWTADSQAFYMLGAHRLAPIQPRLELYEARLRGGMVTTTRLVEYAERPTLSSLLSLTLQGVNRTDGR